MDDIRTNLINLVKLGCVHKRIMFTVKYINRSVFHGFEIATKYGFPSNKIYLASLRE